MQDAGTGVYILHAVPWVKALGGTLRMVAHTMSLLLCCLVALVIPAYSLKCHSCIGSDNECSPTEVTCPGVSDKCATTALYIDSFPCKVRKVFKGCINSTTPSKKVSLSPNDLTTLSLQQDMCDSDLCNTHKVSDPDTNSNGLYCYSCISPGTSCTSETMKQMRCMGEQNQCADVNVIGSFGDIADVNIKGCGQIPSCTKDLVFSSQTSSVSVKCCKGNYCNSDTDIESEDKTPNGIQCYSCNTLGGESCSPEEVVKSQCYGDLTSCLEVSGITMKGDRPMPTIIKGCATPSMCDSSVLPLLQKLGTATVKCCNGSLCNNQLSESSLKASGYLPIGKASPGTGIKKKYPLSPVKTGHHANNKYGTDSMSPSFSSSTSNCDDINIFSAVNSPNMYPGNGNGEGVKGGSWNSNSNNGYPNPSLNSYNEFSNSGSVHDPSITTTQVDQGTSYNDLSIENPNSVHGSNIFSAGGQTTDNDGILFADSESHTLSSPINYSSGEDNLSVIAQGGSALGGEGVSDTPNYHSNDNSIPDVPPTFPDLNSYVDDNMVTNSNYNNNMNHPNNNDFSSYEGAGFTDVVYDWDEDQSRSPTVVPDTILLSNNKTSVHSPGNNGSIQNLTPTTSKTPNSDINQQISGYDTNIHNTGIASNNASGNNITSSGYNSSAGTSGIFTESESHNVSSPMNYSSGGNNLGVLAPGGSALGGQNVSSTPNYRESSITDAPSTFPDFTSYDNNMNPNNNDFSSYESVGFTDIVYVDIEEDAGQPSSSTVVPDSILSNSYDSTGNNDFSSYEGAGFTDIVYEDIDSDDGQSSSPTVAPDNSAYNPNTILLANENKTSGHSADIVNNGSNVQENNSNVQNPTPTTPKIPNSDINQQISGYSTNIHNTGNAYTNCSGNNIFSSGNNTAGSGNTSSVGPESGSHNVSSPMNCSSGENNLNTVLSGGLAVNREGVSETPNYNSNDNSIPDVPPTFPDVPSYVDDNMVTNSNFDNNMNHPNNIDINSYDSAGFTEVVYDWNDDESNSPTVVPDNIASNSYDSVGNNDFNSYDSAGFTEVVYDWDEDQYSSSTVAPNSIVSNSNNSVGNSGSDNSAYNPDTILLSNNNETSGHSSDTMNINSNVHTQGNNGSIQHLTPTSSKTHNSDIKQHISGHGTNIYNTGFANNNGSGNYISSSGNNTAGSGNTSSTGGYANMPGGNGSSTTYTSSENGTRMTNEGNNSNNSSNYNIAVPGGYGNIPAGNHSSPSYGSSGNGTGMTNEWIHANGSSHNMAIPVGYNNTHGNNHTSTSYTGNGTGMTNVGGNSNNSSNYNIAVPVGYGNIPAGNHSSPSYGSSGNGTGMTNEWNHANDSSHNMAIPVGYNNAHGNNHSSTSYTGSGTGMSNEWGNSNNSSNHNIAVPVGYGNIPASNHSSSSYGSPGNGTGMTYEWINSNDSSHNMAIPVGYNNIPGNNHSSTSYTGNGTGMSNEWSNSNHFNPNMSAPGAYANIPGSNGSSTSYTSTGNGTGLINEWINNNSSHHNMASPGGHYGSFNNNGSNYVSNSNYSSTFMMPNNGSSYGNSSSFEGSWDSIESYLNHVLSGENNNGSYSNTKLDGLFPSSNSNGTTWGSNNSNGSSSNDIQNFLSAMNGYIHGNGSKNVTEWIQNNSFISKLLPPGMNHNGSGPYNMNSLFNGTLSDYFKGLGASWNNSINNITSMFSGGKNGPFNINNLGSGLGNIMNIPNLMNPHNNGGSSYNQNPNPNSNGYHGESGSNGQPNSNSNGMSSGGYNDGSTNGNGHNSYAVPSGGSNNGNSYNTMGNGLNGSMLGSGNNLQAIPPNSYIPNELVPGRSTNDSAGGGGAGDESSNSSACALWTKSGSLVMFSAIALLVLN